MAVTYSIPMEATRKQLCGVRGCVVPGHRGGLFNGRLRPEWLVRDDAAPSVEVS